MWRFRSGEGDSPWLRTLNGHAGRQVWTFDPEATPEELADVERAREEFRNHRFEKKHSADLLMRLQFARENPLGPVLPRMEVAENEDVGEEVVTTTLRRAMNFYSTIQASDGQWPGDYGGPILSCLACSRCADGDTTNIFTKNANAIVGRSSQSPCHATLCL
ncbi:unnamed protein product [Spirodela intermedia]|uniref:Cycloartenol synthase n=1 Tax=Spirodela intermedia TaxID=51605 RepID=A0ABN7ECN5_SPIIN|nr:unnamed protein product [Spirodela intermedia]